MFVHVQVDEEGFTKILTSGKKLEKIQLESYLNHVLLAKVVDGEYVFEVVPNNNTVKTYNGIFDKDTVPNDIVAVVKAIREF